MLTRLYIEGLLVDEESADQVWELWNAGVITDDLAAPAWWLVAAETPAVDTGPVSYHVAVIVTIDTG